ncbi:hypothetical protein ACA910_012911 [Epithemia clementina (nom. ined.)]
MVQPNGTGDTERCAETASSSSSSSSSSSGKPSSAQNNVGSSIITTTSNDEWTTSDVVVANKGRNVSGRTWKLRSQQQRATALVNTKKNNRSKPWQDRLEQKRLRQETLALQKELQESKRQEALLKKERRLENERRRAENEYNNVKKSIQTLNYDTANLKLKAMSKKKLRQIKKTRLNPKTGVVEFVSPYAK